MKNLHIQVCLAVPLVLVLFATSFIFSYLGRRGPLFYLRRHSKLLASKYTGNIYFVETSNHLDVSLLFKCSVESAARAHPNSLINVLMRGLSDDDARISSQNVALSRLREFPNVVFKPLVFEDLFSDTPLQSWFAKLDQEKEKFLFSVLSDACRIALLYKYGGVYSDTDVIMTKNLMNLTNAMGLESDNIINGAILVFLQPKSEFLWLCIQDFVENYKGNHWGTQGPQLVTRVLKQYCDIKEISSCKNVTVLPVEAFYPISYKNWRQFYSKASDSVLENLQNKSYTVHVWNQMKKWNSLQVKMEPNMLLGQLFLKFCPVTYNTTTNA
ncbi:lactosylceramide 4-alpha-galactosyltransferase-like [Latimeria chalumnae]|uniref:lactosylceramide 4-alpha-galactosyltransferase-like n=1 Tax=Latimeria chalumnae TaxID=7897 RepID=UPI00313C4FC8